MKLEIQFSTWSDNKVRELIAVEVLHTLLLNITVVAFRVLPLGKLCTSASAQSTLRNNFGIDFVEWLSELSRITPDVINVIKMPSF
jgi:hypothetical protein